VVRMILCGDRVHQGAARFKFETRQKRAIAEITREVPGPPGHDHRMGAVHERERRNFSAKQFGDLLPVGRIGFHSLQIDSVVHVGIVPAAEVAALAGGASDGGDAVRGEQRLYDRSSGSGVSGIQPERIMSYCPRPATSKNSSMLLACLISRLNPS